MNSKFAQIEKLVTKENIMKTLGSVNGTANRYEIDTDKGRIEVYANTLEEAKRVAGLAGFTVTEG